MAQGFFRGKTLCAAVQLGVADALGAPSEASRSWRPRPERNLRRCMKRVDRELEDALMLDLNMLVVAGGGERSESAWRALLASERLEMRRVLPAEGTRVRIIEALPV